MPRDWNFADQLCQWGPRSQHATPSLSVAQQYCQWLARTHYENFSVASWFVDRQLLESLHAVYAYCRWADDLADETANASQALELLAWWQAELDAAYQGEARHPVFVALSPVIESGRLPKEPLADLLIAFRQDQTKTRYANMEELLNYCRYSANPVGRIVLHLGKSFSEENAALSDHICTGLQLANFWQDVRRDFERGRIYIPGDEMLRAGMKQTEWPLKRPLPEFRQMMKNLVARAEMYFKQGEPLIPRVADELKLEVALFLRGGRAVLEAIRRQNYDVWLQRPVVTKWQKLAILGSAWWQRRRSAS